MSRLRIFSLVFALAGTLGGVSYAQTISTSTLVGTARDATGAVVPGAKIKVVNVDTQFASETISSAEGSYTVLYLSPGNYRLTVEKPGFKTYTQEGIYIHTDETPRI